MNDCEHCKDRGWELVQDIQVNHVADPTVPHSSGKRATAVPAWTKPCSYCNAGGLKPPPKVGYYSWKGEVFDLDGNHITRKLPKHTLIFALGPERSPAPSPSSSNYLKALEMRLGWLRWIEDSSLAETVNDNEMLETAAYSLMTSGGTYFMSKPFCDLVEHWRKQLPDDLAFDMKWLQTDEGFVWFDSPFQAAAPEGATGNMMRAMSWCKPSERRDLSSATYIVFYADLADWKVWDDPRTQYGFMTNGAFLVKDGCLLGEANSEMLNQMPGYKGIHRDATMLPLAFAAFYLMGQRLAIKSEMKPDRAMRRRMADEKQEPPFLPAVQVITLRRLERQGVKPEPGHEGNIDYHWQWIVAKHMRRQYYPSLGSHKYILIDSYVKGPEDKPLKPPVARIYVAQR